MKILDTGYSMLDSRFKSSGIEYYNSNKLLNQRISEDFAMTSKYYTLPNEKNLDELIFQAKKLTGIKTKREVLIYAMQLYVDYLERQHNISDHSFYELTKHLAGSIEEPSDLAHNKKYMEGFGL